MGWYAQQSTVHLGYNDVSIPQSRIALSKLSLYPERFTEGTGIMDSMGPNRNKEDFVISRIVITRVDCAEYYCVMCTDTTFTTQGPI